MSASGRCAAALASCVLSFTLALPAQDCGTLPPWTPPPGVRQFTPRQKQWLFQFELDQSMGELGTVSDRALTGEIEDVFQRLLAHLPPLSPPPAVHLLADDSTDAVTMSSGQIYISRAMIRSLHSEAELAAILAHELGHYYAGQPGILYSASLDKVLDHAAPALEQAAFDDQLNRWESWREAHFSQDMAKGSDQRQEGADEAGMEALRRAGYDTAAMAAAFDRTAGTRGQTGNWFSSWLGLNSPDVERLRKIQQSEALLPACPSQPPLLAASAFAAWQAALDAYVAPATAPSLPGLIRQVSLDPLRGHLASLTFSADGRYLLAVGQDDAWVLTVEPFALRLHIEAQGIDTAHFNPETSAVVLSTTSGRVERWDLASRTEVYARQAAPPDPGCVSAVPDMEGRQLVCVRADGRTQVLDADTGAVRYEHKAPAGPGMQRISPDGRYFLRGGYEQLWVLDLGSDTEVRLGGEARHLLNGSFSFANGGQAMAASNDQGTEWKRFDFPSGKVTADWKLGAGRYFPPASGALLLARPYFHSAAAVIDPADGKVLATSAAADLDAWGNLIAGENARGVLVLVRLDPAHPGQETPVAHVELPRPQLHSVIAAEASPDLRYLAVSESRRGALWDLSRPQAPPEILTGFDDAWFDLGQLWLHDVRAPNLPRSLPALGFFTPQNEAEVDLATGQRQNRKLGLLKLEQPESGQIVALDNKAGLEIEDLKTGKRLWGRKLRWDSDNDFLARPLVDGPGGTRTLLAFWLGDNFWTSEPMDKAARQAIADAPDHRAAFWYEIVNAQTGAFEHGLVVEPSPVPNPARTFLLGDNLYLPSVQDNRLIAYSLTSGRPVRWWDGAPLDFNRQADLFALLRTHQDLALYPNGAARPRAEFHFPERVTFVQFSADGRQLLVVTRDQTAYLLAVPAAPSAAAAQNPL